MSVVGTPDLASQAEDKANAKAEADVRVATVPEALHHVKMAIHAPSVWGSTAAGAAIGAAFGGPPGVPIGALVGFAVERYQIFGGPIGRAFHKLRSKF
jgi:hypothetical protein